MKSERDRRGSRRRTSSGRGAFGRQKPVVEVLGVAVDDIDKNGGDGGCEAGESGGSDVSQAGNAVDDGGAVHQSQTLLGLELERDQIAALVRGASLHDLAAQRDFASPATAAAR